MDAIDTGGIMSATLNFATSQAHVHATTSCEMQAAAIARRLIEDEGREATIHDTADVTLDGFPVGTLHSYVVLIHAG